VVKAAEAKAAAAAAAEVAFGAAAQKEQARVVEVLSTNTEERS
jgi:hypothetical protein